MTNEHLLNGGLIFRGPMVTSVGRSDSKVRVTFFLPVRPWRGSQAHAHSYSRRLHTRFASVPSSPSLLTHWPISLGHCRHWLANVHLKSYFYFYMEIGQYGQQMFAMASESRQ